MIRGLGCDAVELARIRNAVDRRGETFARRVLADIELVRWGGMAPDRQVEFLAGRFAAKEAVAKAAGCGIGRMGLRSVAIVEGPGGLTLAWTAPPDGQLTPAWHSGRWHISITHTRDTAFAVAVWET